MPALAEIMEIIKQLKARIRNLEALEIPEDLPYLEMCEQGIEDGYYKEE